MGTLGQEWMRQDVCLSLLPPPPHLHRLHGPKTHQHTDTHRKPIRTEAHVRSINNWSAVNNRSMQQLQFNEDSPVCCHLLFSLCLAVTCLQKKHFVHLSLASLRHNKTLFRQKLNFIGNKIDIIIGFLQHPQALGSNKPEAEVKSMLQSTGVFQNHIWSEFFMIPMNYWTAQTKKPPCFIVRITKWWNVTDEQISCGKRPSSVRCRDSRDIMRPRCQKYSK